MQKSAGKPLVVLATLPGEEHTLGLLMLTAMLSARGISAINLGGEGVCRLRKLPACGTKFNSLENLPLPAESPGAPHGPLKNTA